MCYPLIDDNAGDWVMLDGRLIPADHPDTVPLFAGTGDTVTYEVIRVEDGVPLFWEDHMTRLERSAAGVLTPDPDALRAQADRLLDRSGPGPCNLRIVLTRGRTVLHLSRYYYPDQEQVVQGVPCGILDWERETPNVKTVRPDYKAAVAAALARPLPDGSRPFEVLLADRTGHLTEGSRTNVFFVADGSIVTAPDDRILLGVTRRHVQDAVSRAGLRMVTGLLTLDDLRAGRAEAAFLTGSPIDVLPVSRVWDVPLQADHALTGAVRHRYLEILSDYVRRHAREPRRS